MAFASWKESPLDEPMARVAKRTYGNGKIRYVVESYTGTIHANWEAVEEWEYVREYKSEKKAKKPAEKLSAWKRSNSYCETTGAVS